ncbi:MAG: hypothetical protein LBE85_14505, partial [Candidatus Accumulibacter sp.]|nr:hypothetical protein [Accumulibacter sp.]
MEGFDIKKAASGFAAVFVLGLVLASCGGGGGGGSAEAPVEPPYEGHAWFDPAIVARQNAATTDEEKEAVARERAQLLIAAMNEDQKLGQLTGQGASTIPEVPQCYGGRHVEWIPELGIRTLRITNGPVGVGQNDCGRLEDRQPLTSEYSAKATGLPSGMAVAASFDRNLARMYGEIIGDEMRSLGLDVLEAPGVNMARLPIAGRNFEYFGEDPYLVGTMAVEEALAIKERGLIAMPKHFVANDQETQRQLTFSNVDEQVLHEIYLL